MTTIGRCQIDDETKFPRRVVDVLSLEGALFSLIRPCQPFVEVKSAVENGRSQDQPPSHRFHKKSADKETAHSSLGRDRSNRQAW